MSGYRCSSHIGKILIFMCQCFIPKCMLFILWTKRQCFNVATGVKVTINMCAYSYLSKICAPTHICQKYVRLLVFVQNMCAYSYLSKMCAPSRMCKIKFRPIIWNGLIKIVFCCCICSVLFWLGECNTYSILYL